MSPNVPVFGGSIYRALVDAASDAIVVVDKRGLIVLINPQTEKLFGYTRTEMLGQPVEMLVPEKFRAHHHGLRGAFVNSPKTRPMGPQVNLSGRRKDGTEFPVDIALSPIESEAGSLVYAAVRDVSHRRDIEEKFRSLLDTAPDAMIVADEKGKIVLVNLQAENLFGYSRKEMLHQPVEMLLPERLRASHEKHRLEYLKKPLMRPMGLSMELMARRRNGTEFPVEISLSPQKTKEGMLVSSSIRDISARRQIAKENSNVQHDSASEIVAAGQVGQIILYVEEQILLREWAAEYLRGLGYVVLTVPDASGARAVATSAGAKIDLLVSDFFIPGGTGANLADAILAGHPKMKVLYTAGHSSEAMKQSDAKLPEHVFLWKPFSLSDLAKTVKKTIESAGPELPKTQSGMPAMLTAPFSSK